MKDFHTETKSSMRLEILFQVMIAWGGWLPCFWHSWQVTEAQQLGWLPPQPQHHPYLSLPLKIPMQCSWGWDKLALWGTIVSGLASYVLRCITPKSMWWLMGAFMNGLRDEIRAEMRLFSARDIHSLLLVAQRVEERMLILDEMALLLGMLN